jgi:Nif-specific regulatory protein
MPNPAAPITLVASTARADLAADVHIDVDWPQHELFCRRELAKIFGKTLDPLDGIRQIFHLLSELLGLNRGRLVLQDPATGLLHVRCAYGLTREQIERGCFRPGEGITGQAFVSGEAAIVQDVDAEPAYLWRTARREDLPRGTISVFTFPVRVNGRIRGVFSVNRFRAVSRSLADDIEILRDVAGQISQILRIEEMVTEQIQRQTAQLRAENQDLKQALDGQSALFGVIGESLKLHAALRQIGQVAPTDATVLLLGESGTGKELFARAVHQAGPRREAPFVKLNCGAIPEALFESELFGHEKGAFTGATSAKAGLFECANGGTLFLDEIGDLPLGMQVKLLRTLQERSVLRVGARIERPVDVRIVAATHQDLQVLVAQGRFRLDLFYRLHVMPIRLPPLRERPEDIAPLVRHLLAQANRRFRREVTLSEAALARLVRYHWPGNVRQLQNLVDRLVLLAPGQAIDEALAATMLASETIDSPGAYASSLPAPAPVASAPAAVLATQRRVVEDDRAAIISALSTCGGVKSRAAQRLGLTLSQLNYRLRVLGIG